MEYPGELSLIFKPQGPTMCTWMVSAGVVHTCAVELS